MTTEKIKGILESFKDSLSPEAFAALSAQLDELLNNWNALVNERAAIEAETTTLKSELEIANVAIAKLQAELEEVSAKLPEYPIVQFQFKNKTYEVKFPRFKIEGVELSSKEVEKWIGSDKDKLQMLVECNILKIVED